MKLTINLLVLFLVNCINAESEFADVIQGVVKILYSDRIDINGDGLIDRIGVFRLSKNNKIKGEYVSINPWNKKDVWKKEDTHIVIAFSVSSDEGKKPVNCFIFNQSFFSSPIWQEKKLPISVVSGDSAKVLIKTFCNSNAKGDLVMLGTEAGINIYIYWDGIEFNVCEPDEEP